MSDPRAGGWGRGAEPLPSPPPAPPEAPGPWPRARGAAARPPAGRAAPEMRLRPPGYVTRDLRFPLHAALGRAQTQAPAALPPSPAAGVVSHRFLLRRRLASHSFPRAFERPLHQRLQDVAAAPGARAAVLGFPPAHRLLPLPCSLASRRQCFLHCFSLVT